MAFVAIAAFALGWVRFGQAAESLEYQVKAAFLLNFTKFIDWPPDAAGATNTMDICILGDDPFGPMLDQIVADETMQGRKLQIQRVQRPVPASCRVIFINKSEKDIDDLLQGFAPGVLTVGEGEAFLRAGGMIAFVVENRRVRFDVNHSAAAKSHLVISSKLLNVARTVEK